MIWISTQEKSTLLSPSAIWVEQDRMNKQDVLEAQTTPETQWRLGHFATKTAALAELDRIRWWIADGGKGVYQVGEG